jgi:hypothetical protein
MKYLFVAANQKSLILHRYAFIYRRFLFIPQILAFFSLSLYPLLWFTLTYRLQIFVEYWSLAAFFFRISFGLGVGSPGRGPAARRPP